MWTCNPQSDVSVPEKDELYDRKTDQFQLNNIVENNRDVAKQLLQKLRLYIGELRTC
jgi:hypothetical protein